MAWCMSDTQDNMNPYVIRDKLKGHLGQKVLVKIYGMRNKNETYTGTLNAIYPQIFTIEKDGTTKSYSYSEIINGEIVLTFK